MSKRLFKAAQQGDFNELAGTGDDLLEATDLAENTALHVAVMTGQDDFAKDLCKRCPLLLMKENMEGNTPLHCALKSARDESLFIYFMNVFLSQVGDQQRGWFKANRDRESLLFLAADRSSLECVNLLLQSGVRSDFEGPNGWTALHAAVFRRNKEIAKVLLQKDPELNRKKDASGNTPLHYAAAYDDLEMVTCILDKDEDVVTYELNKDGHSPLHVAAGCGGVDTVKALVERCPGCVMLKDNKRRNPLHIAVEAGRRNVVEHILKNYQFGGLMSDRDCDGNTPLHLSTIKGDHCMALLLVSMMPNMGINPVNNEGLTPHDILYPKRKTRIDSLVRRIILRCLGGEVGPIQYAFIRAGGMHGPRLCHLMNILKRSRRGKSCDKEDGRDDRIKGSTNSLLVMATLIIAVTFTAIITMPGGFESDTKPANSYGGTAVLTKRASFQAFVILDTLAFIFAFIAAGRLIWTSAWKGLELKINMLQNVNLMHAALMAMTLAFGTGAYSVLTRHCPWLGIVTLIGGSIIAYIPSVNLLLLMPFYYEKKKKITRALDWARNQSKLKKKRVVL